jgi:tetratricopeptide (TPR) repeat protein
MTGGIQKSAVRDTGSRYPVYGSCSSSRFHPTYDNGDVIMKTGNKLLALVFVAVTAIAAGLAWGADDPDPVTILMSKSQEFAQGKRAADAKDWNTAIKWFNAADQRMPNNADIHNALGYAYRNGGQLEPAFKHYQRALQINPRHLGVHEYIGEAYLLSKNLLKAEEHLAALNKFCPRSCEERDDLAKKVADYKQREGK